jgi:hypothetical protein
MSTCEGCQPKPTYTEAVKRYQKCAVVDCTYVTVDVVETIDIYGASTFEVSFDGNVVTPTPQLLECKDPIPTVPACAADVAPPTPFTVEAEDCNGDVVEVTGLPGQLVQTVQAAGTVTKVAFCDSLLSDACPSLSPIEQVVNGNFSDAGAGGQVVFNWVQEPAQFQTGSVTVVGGAAQWPAAGPYSSAISQALTLVPGEQYQLSFDVLNATSSVPGVLLDGSIFLPTIPVIGNNVYTFVAPANPSPVLRFATGFFTSPFQLDNVSVRQLVVDRVLKVTLPDCVIDQLTASRESDSIEMCDEGTTFLRWFVKENGVPTGQYVDTDMNGGQYEPTGTPTPGACAVVCNPATAQGVVNTWG